MTTNCMLAHRHIKLKKVRGEEMTRNDKPIKTDGVNKGLLI